MNGLSGLGLVQVRRDGLQKLRGTCSQGCTHSVRHRGGGVVRRDEEEYGVLVDVLGDRLRLLEVDWSNIDKA